MVDPLTLSVTCRVYDPKDNTLSMSLWVVWLTVLFPYFTTHTSRTVDYVYLYEYHNNEYSYKITCTQTWNRNGVINWRWLFTERFCFDTTGLCKTPGKEHSVVNHLYVEWFLTTRDGEPVQRSGRRVGPFGLLRSAPESGNTLGDITQTVFWQPSKDSDITRRRFKPVFPWVVIPDYAL